MPEYPLFLQEVARHTRPGESVAVLVPMRDWNLGYAYAYYRASYFLAGRRVVPLVTPDNQARLERVREAQLIAIWQMPPPAEGYTVVWEGHGGVLVRKKG